MIAVIRSQLCVSATNCLRPERVSEIHGVLDRLADSLIKSPADRLEQMEW